jgi:hypothetical protein
LNRRFSRAAAVVIPAALVALGAVGWTGCGEVRSEPASPTPPPASAAASSSGASAAPLKSLALVYDKQRKPVPGTAVRVTGQDLPPNRTLMLMWGTVDGGWVVEDYYRFRGKKFTEVTRPLGEAVTDGTGRLSASFDIPEDYGGVHEVTLTDDGTPIAQAAIEVGQEFEVHPTEGPVGTPIELRVRGLGWRTMESTWVVNWDNREVGWVSATSTRGSAVARFRAAGPPGDHVINVLTGYMGQGYLNHEQAPNAYLPRPTFAFRVTPERANVPAAYAEPYTPQPLPASSGIDGATASLTPAQGPVQTATVLRAKGLPAGAAVSVAWGTAQGSRVSGDGFGPEERDLGTQTVGKDGTVTVRLTVPEDVGGLHAVSIRSGEETVATTHFFIETSIVGISATSGPVGTPVTIRLKGVGWTEYDNIYIATYDNAYMGYACGFNSQGDVTINFTAAGAPGVHLIDLYPGIYKGPEGGQQLYRLPQLTYADDHPGNRIPALRFTFEITPAPPRTH